MVVYICCAGGATSGLFCKNIESICVIKGIKAYVDDILSVCKLVKEKKLHEYDLILGYGAAGVINESYMIENNIQNIVNQILIAPQVRFQANKIKEVAKKYKISCEVIQMTTFGRMDGKKGLAFIEKIANDNKRT